MSYFHLSEAKIGTCAQWSNGWDKIELVFKGDGVIPGVLREMREDRMIAFPEKEIADFFRTSSMCERRLSVMGKDISLSFGIYGSTGTTLSEVKEWAKTQILPLFEDPYKRVDEIRGIMLVLKHAEEAKA